MSWTGYISDTLCVVSHKLPDTRRQPSRPVRVLPQGGNTSMRRSIHSTWWLVAVAVATCAVYHSTLTFLGTVAFALLPADQQDSG